MAKNNLITAHVNFDKKLDLYSLTFNGIKFYSQQKDSFFIPVSVLEGINISIFPTSVNLVPYKYILFPEIIFPDRLLTIRNNGNSTATIEIEACCSATAFTDSIGVEAFQALKKELIKNSKKFNPIITFYTYSEGIVHLHYRITVPSDKIEELIKTANSFNDDLDEQILNAIPDTLQNTRNVLSQQTSNKTT